MINLAKLAIQTKYLYIFKLKATFAGEKLKIEE
jgi:hypothetical protein